MGSPENETERRDAERQHWVTISQPFYISKFEISQDEWKAVMGRNPSRHAATGAPSDKVPLNTGTYPVEEVSFNDALDFCQKLPELNGWKALLPTEAEWEYACRAGSNTVFPWGNSLNGDRANCDGRYPYGVNEQGPNIGRPVEVGCYAPNAWGIHDMIGNVREWCLDSFHEFDSIAVTDPVYINHNGKRVSRGGAWGSLAWGCRTSHRVDFDAFSGNPGVGVRIIYKKHNPSVNYREPVEQAPQFPSAKENASSSVTSVSSFPSPQPVRPIIVDNSTPSQNIPRQGPAKGSLTFVVPVGAAQRIRQEGLPKVKIGKLVNGKFPMVVGKSIPASPISKSGNHNQYELLYPDGRKLGLVYSQVNLVPGSVYSDIYVYPDPIKIAGPKTPRQFSDYFVIAGVR